jgi:hypothetical protein
MSRNGATFLFQNRKIWRIYSLTGAWTGGQISDCEGLSLTQNIAASIISFFENGADNENTLTATLTEEAFRRAG